jgi:hypothetical protein
MPNQVEKMNLSDANEPLRGRQDKSPYKLTVEQEKVYVWLKCQELNVDDNTLNYWARKYHPQRIVDVVQFAHVRRAEGQQIRNMGGWIHKFLRDGTAVVTNVSQDNRRLAQQYATENQWTSLHIYEKYIKDDTTGDDLSLTLPRDEFLRALESFHQRIQRYSDLQ